MSRRTGLFLLISYHLTVGYCQRVIGDEKFPPTQILSKEALESIPYVPLNSLTTREGGSGNFFQWVYDGPSLLRQMLEEHNSNVTHESNSPRPPEYHAGGSNPIDSRQGLLASSNGEPQSGDGSLPVSMTESLDYDKKYRKDKGNAEIGIILINPSDDDRENETLFTKEGLTGENPIQNLSKSIEEIINSVDPISSVNGNKESYRKRAPNLQPYVPPKPEYSEESANAYNEYVFEHFNLKNPHEHEKKENDNIIDRFVNHGVKEDLAKLENNSGQNQRTESNIIWIYTTMPTQKVSNAPNFNYHFTTELPQTSTKQPTTLLPVFQGDPFGTNTIIPPIDAIDRENANNLTDDANRTVGAFGKPITNTWKPPIKMPAYDFSNKTTLPRTTTDAEFLPPSKPFAESVVNDLSIHALQSTPHTLTTLSDVSDTTLPPDWFEILEDENTHNKDSGSPDKSEDSTIASVLEYDLEAEVAPSNEEVNIWNYLKEYFKASQNNAQQFALTNGTMTSRPIDGSDHQFSEMLYQIQFDESQNDSSSDVKQLEESGDSSKESVKHPNETQFPNLYELILHRISNGSEKVDLKLNQTEDNGNKGDNMAGLVANHTLFTNETKEDGMSYQLISLKPSNHTVDASGKISLNVTNGSNEFGSSTVNGHLMKNTNKLPIQNIYQIFQENNNVNSNILSNLQNNHQIININNHLASVPSSWLDLGENLENGTKDSLGGDIGVSNSPPSKPKETLLASQKPSSISKQNDTMHNTFPLDDPSMISHSDIMESGFPGYPTNADGPSIPSEELPVDLSSLLQENGPINNPTTENNVDILKNIDPETLVYDYIQTINAASKLFNENDLSNPQIQDIIQDIALELLLSYLMKENNQSPIQPYENFTTVSENTNEKKNTSLLEKLVYLGLGDNKESASRNPLRNISNISYNILSKLIEESTTMSSESPSFTPTENIEIYSLPNTDSANLEAFLPNRDSLVEDLWQIFDKTIPSTDSNKMEVSSDGSDNINYDLTSDLAYYEYNNPNYEIINDFIGSESLYFADEVVTTRPSFTGTIKNSLTSLTNMITDLVPEGVTYEWCINSRGCSFALAASLALSVIGATGAVIPFGRRKKQLNSGESRIFSNGSSNFDINGNLMREFERILKELALNKRKRMSDNLTVHKADIVNHLKNEYKRILKWKKKTTRSFKKFV